MIVEELAARLGLEINEAAWKSGEKLVENLKDGFKDLQKTLTGSVAHAIEAFISFEAVKHVAEFVEQTVDAAVAAKRLGERVGISAEAVQELGYAANISGASAEDMQVSLQFLARGLEELRTKGTGPAADGLQELGLHFSAIKGKSPDQVLAVLADQFAKMPDGTKKTAVAMDLFGRSGTTLIPLLNKGSKGIKELREEAEKMGVVIGESGIKRSEEFERTQKRLHATLEGLRNQVVTALLPGLNKIGNSVLKWVTANKKLIASKLKEYIPTVINGLKTLGEVILYLIKVFGWLSDNLEVAIPLLLVVAAIFAPWELAIAAVVAVIYDLWNAIANGEGVTATVVKFLMDEWQKFEDYLSGMWDRIKQEAGAAAQWLKDKLGLQWLQDNIGGQAGDGSVQDQWNKTLGGAAMGQQATPSVAPSVQNSAAMSAATNVNLTINGAAGTPEDIHKAVKAAVTDAQKDMLRQAMGSVKGGQK